MKFDSVNYLSTKFGEHIQTSISLSICCGKEYADSLKDILNQKRNDYNLHSNLFYSMFKYNENYRLIISIIHNKEESKEEIKNAIEEILSFNSVFSLLYHGKFNYYSFLCDLIIKEKEDL